MKIEGKGRDFEPVTITLESRAELSALHSILHYGSQRMETCPPEIKRHYMYLDLICHLRDRLLDFI